VIDRVGQHIGNYQLVQLLGRGSQASVYLGKHRYLNSYAALKMLNATIQSGDEPKFTAEAQTLVNLRHPNIVHLLDFAIENGIPVLIMDYAPKGSLRQQYPAETQMPLTTVVGIVAQIAAALQYAHNHHVIHRDVKPENILLDADNHLLLSDFGLSLFTPPSQELITQDPAGTPRYMAPEQLRGKPGFASDQYALAIMVYEWLCGKLPFRGTIWEIWQQHLYTDPPSLRIFRPELPPMLEQVVLRALAKKPQDRFVSIQAFALALRRASQTAIPVDENDSQMTAPMQAILRSSLRTPLHHVPYPQRAQILATTPEVLRKPPSVPALQNQNRVRMLGRLRRAFSDLMSQSLQGTAWLELGIAEKPDAVQNVTNLVLHVPNRAVQHLPPDASIIQAYDEAEHELLILGEPGAGKSTLLLDLAQQLVVRAEQDETHPLPVILPLSSWAVKRPQLEDWIAEQMSEIYDLPRKLSEQWVQEGRILPLLDGLDEMEQVARPACIAAINAYHRDHLAPLVVSSRTVEYKAATEHHRLALLGAVVVQPLTHEHVNAYLARAGKPLAALRSTLQKNRALYDLATTPLMLNILILTYQGTAVYDYPSKETLLLQQVCNDYVVRMVERKGNSKSYPLVRVRSWLGWLAGQMRAHNQAVFYLEHLQPTWLAARYYRAYSWLAVRLPGMFIGILAALIITLFLNGGNPTTLFQHAVLGCFLGGFFSEIPTRDVSPQKMQNPLRLLVGHIAISAFIGIIYASGLQSLLSLFYGPENWFHAFGIVAITISLSCLVLLYLRPLFFSQRSRDLPIPTRRSAVFFPLRPNTVPVQHVLLVAVIFGAGRGLSTGLSTGLGTGLSAGLSTGLEYGLISLLIYLVLRAQARGVYLTERIRWSVRILVKPAHLLGTTLFTLSIGVVSGLSNMLTIWLTSESSAGLSIGLHLGLTSGLSLGLSAGLSYWLLLGLVQGIASEQIENRDRRIPNQGIQRSLRNCLMLGAISIVLIWLSYWLNSVLGYGLTYGLTYGLNAGLNYGVRVGWLAGCYGGLLICAASGGLAVLRHAVLRFLLWHSRTFPWKTIPFLNDATTRTLLQHVGGGYRFTHRLLLDFFADQD
jgi:serine/threonine protein kinase